MLIIGALSISVSFFLFFFFVRNTLLEKAFENQHTITSANASLPFSH